MIFGLVMWGGACRGERIAVVLGPPLPGGDHLPLRMAVLRFSLRFREVEELMLTRGAIVPYESLRRWYLEYVPRVVVTNKLHSCGAAHRQVMPVAEHRTPKYLNNPAENSHQPTRQRERAMEGFHFVDAAQRFLFSFSGVSSHFRPRRHLITAAGHRAEMATRFAIWDQITGAAVTPTMA